MLDDDHEDLIKVDPIEKNPRFFETIKQAEEEAERNIAKMAKNMSYYHLLWLEQKRILRDKYKIEWKTPAEMNPEVIFD